MRAARIITAAQLTAIAARSLSLDRMSSLRLLILLVSVMAAFSTYGVGLTLECWRSSSLDCCVSVEAML